MKAMQMFWTFRRF